MAASEKATDNTQQEITEESHTQNPLEKLGIINVRNQSAEGKE